MKFYIIPTLIFSIIIYLFSACSTSATNTNETTTAPDLYGTTQTEYSNENQSQSAYNEIVSGPDNETETTSNPYSFG